MMPPSYATLDGYPVRVTDGDAWIFLKDEGAWRHMDQPADAIMNAALMTEAEFTACFGQLPDLPVTAFQDDGNAAATPP